MTEAERQRKYAKRWKRAAKAARCDTAKAVRQRKATEEYFFERFISTELTQDKERDDGEEQAGD